MLKNRRRGVAGRLFAPLRCLPTARCRENPHKHWAKREIFTLWYLEEMEESCGQELDFDPIGICCEFAEYADWSEFKADHPDIADLEHLEDRTLIIYVDKQDDIAGGNGRFVISRF